MRNEWVSCVSPGANLSEANLQHAVLVRTNLTNANLAGCRIYGISTWDLKLEGAKQENLIITSSIPSFWRLESMHFRS
jgi:uncharacterized protein YjbI with pentapeptide repeats